MKKLVLAAILICGTISVFAEQENWTGAGFSFSNAFEFDDGYKTYLGSPGFHLSGYSFINNKNIGGFAHFAWVFPTVTHGNEQHYNKAADLLLGIGGRHSITDKFKLYGGLGIDFLLMSGSYYNKDAASEVDFSISANAFGIGGDIGIKYDITDFLYVNLGCTAAFLFSNSTSIRSYREENNVPVEYIREDGSLKDYALLTVKPYIGIGVNYYSEGKAAALGKPKK